MPLSEIWTLWRASDGKEQALAAWGVAASGCRITRRTQRADSLEIKIRDAKFDDAELFPYLSQVTLKRNGVPWFAGVATKTPRMGRPNAEGVGYLFEGPWWFLEHVVYQQGWTFLTGVVYRPDWQYYGITPPVGPGASAAAISNLVLAVDAAGIPITTGAQIADALNVAIAAGAPLQIGVIDPALTVPSEGARDITCAEVIRRMLRWSPDCVTWLDYSTTPPTIHIRKRANLTAKSFSTAGLPASAMDLAARPDLAPPVVVLKYERVNHVDDQDQRTLVTDQYPAGVSETQPGAIVMTINLQGDKATYMKQYVKTAAILSSSLAWWQERLPWLNDANISNLALVDGSDSKTAVVSDGGADADSGTDGTDKGSASTTEGTIYANHVLEGEIPNWIDGHAQMALVQVRANYDVTMGNDANGSPVVEHHANETLFVKVMSTDLSTGWYSQLSGVYIGEPTPTGLAQAYYEALSMPQYEGVFEITEQECGAAGGPYLGQVLNLTGSLAEWTTMNAAIFETTEELATGKTRLRFGPVEYLSPGDWVTWLRVNRWRELGDRQARVNGLLTTGSHPVGGTGKHDRGGAGSKGAPQLTTWVGAAADGNPGTYKITIQPATVESPSTIPENLNVRLRPLQVCDLSTGAMTTILVLCSENFTPAG